MTNNSQVVIARETEKFLEESGVSDSLINEMKKTVQNDNKKEEQGNKQESKDVGSGLLNHLKNINDWLEEVPGSLVKFFNTVFKTGEKLSQDAVDMICEWVAYKVNVRIETVRQCILRDLHSKNKIVDALLTPVRAFKNFFTNPLSILGAVVRVVKSILEIFIGPFIALINFVVSLVQEIARLANNLASIAEALPPEPPDPSINFNAFKIKVGTLTLQMLLDDPENMPTPEEVFAPEPTRPFTKEYFSKLGNMAHQSYAEEKPFYKLTEGLKKDKVVDSDSENTSGIV